ncbi:MAG: SCP-2 sterol transfer family protein, partial [Gammaproteobacteria bacterium]|nr:SCP-2 sterol transfer family protein [Gammaproteobacteria bacterium]
MTDLFSGDWMLKFMSEWNNEPELADELAKISFNSSIAYGFKSDSDPTGLVVIADGRITSATEYDDEEVNWDLRADPEDWQGWFE